MIAVERQQSTYILQPCSVKSDTGTPSLCKVSTTSFSMESPYGLAKLGNIVAKHCCRRKCLPVQPRETYVAEANFASWKQGNVSESSQKHFCFADANFTYETYVSQFSHPRKHAWKQCFFNNVSQFSQPLMTFSIHQKFLGISVGNFRAI